MKWWPRWHGDFGAKTRHLTLIERGAYTALLDQYYEQEAPLPPEMESLYRIAGARGADEEKAVRRIASEFFPINGDGCRHNKRADEEIRKWQAKSQSNSAAAKKRWNANGHANASTNGDANA